MKDYLHTQLPNDAVFGMSMLALAHIGDGVYELMIRARECARGVVTAKKMHQNTVRLVSARAQAEAVQHILPILTEQEMDIYLRGRNTKVHAVPKGASHEMYHKATALECLFGYLYLRGQYERLNELFHQIVEEG